MVYQCGNCGHVPFEDEMASGDTGPLANFDATSEPCDECGGDDWVEK